MPKTVKKRKDCVPAMTDAKKLAIAQLVRTARRGRWTYDDFAYVCQQARKKLDIHKPVREKRLTQLLSVADLKRFFAAVSKCDNPQHEILLRFLLVTGLRVSELVNLQVMHVDTEACKIFVQQGKGSKDRSALFPSAFRLTLLSHLRANPRNKYVFESQRKTKFSPRRIQQIVQIYREKAGIKQPVHPHLFRHQMLSFLTEAGLSDAQIQLLSGHASKKSLEVYQHMTLKSVDEAYQVAARTLGM